MVRLYLSSVLSIAALILIPTASASAGTELVVARLTYTPDVLRKMDHDDLNRVSDEFASAMKALRAVTERTSNANVPYDVIRAFARFQFEESQSVLMSLLRTELKKTDTKGNPDPDVVLIAMETLGEFGRLTGDRLREFDELEKEAASRLKLADVNGHPFGVSCDEAFKDVRAQMLPRKDGLPEFQALIAKYEGEAGVAPLARLKRMREILEERVIGQPEVIEAVMDLEILNQAEGRRDAPDAVYLMGLPGTGKDTLAEALTDALHRYPGAYRKHMFRMPLMKTNADLWKVMGSNTGYVGSENTPALLDFLVAHSGGRYKIERIKDAQGKDTFRVVQNAEWKGDTLTGEDAPEKAVVFINEFHNWSKQLKDDFLKQALEKGYFSINNSNGGESEIYVPCRFVIATNEGINLIASREANGQRHGKPLPYEELLTKWQNIRGNVDALKSALLATNGARNETAQGQAPGISEELLSRIEGDTLLLMRPLSPDDLKKIAEMRMKQKTENMANHSRLLGKNQITWSENLINTIQEYDFIAEENARPINARVKSLVFKPLSRMLMNGTLVPGASMTKIHLDLELNPDGTRNLVAEVTPDGKPAYVVRHLIEATLKDRPPEPLTAEEIQNLSGLGERMKTRVFGIDPILDRLRDRILSVANSMTAKGDRKASVLILDGLSSTGKTETAKQLPKMLPKEFGELVTFDFSNIQSDKDFKEMIFGSTDFNGNPIPSKFMKEYDRRNGRIAVALDELPNVRDLEQLKRFYDLFREEVVGNFSDGKGRAMAGVMFIVTGNASQHLYLQVPSNIPMEAQMAAWAEIYRQTGRDQALTRRQLGRVYPDALLNRVGKNNIFLMPPHTWGSLRALAQLKLGLALKELAKSKSKWGWNVVFPSTKEYSDFITMILKEGFALREQGASIDNFIKDDIYDKLDSLLISHLVPSGSTVVLTHRETGQNHDREKPGYVTYDVHVEGRAAPLELKIERPWVEAPLEPDENIMIATAAHEAGHSLVREALFPGAYTPVGVSVIPGVTMIGDQWIYYLGLAEHEEKRELTTTRELVVRQIAVLLAGETAERLVTKNETHSAGKSNDIERANGLARYAILKYGLMEKWGLLAPPSHVTIEAYVASLPESQRVLLHKETQKLLKEARRMAQHVIEANYNSGFVPLTHELAERGKMDRDDLKAFYDAHVLVDPFARTWLMRLQDWMRTKVRKLRNGRAPRSVQIELDTHFPRPRKVADPKAIVEEYRRTQFEAVALPDDLPLGSNAAYGAVPTTHPLPVRTVPCEDLLANAS